LEAGYYQASANDEDGCGNMQTVVAAKSEEPTITHIDTRYQLSIWQMAG